MDFKKESKMNEKRILIAVLLSMAFQVEARSSSKGIDEEKEVNKDDKDEKKQEAALDKKRSTLEKSIKSIKKTIDELEDKKSDAISNDKKGSKGRVINHEPVKVDHLTKEIKDQKDTVGKKEEALAKLSDETREKAKDEYYALTATANTLDKKRRVLREKLERVKNSIKTLSSEELKGKNELHNDKDAHKDLLTKNRYAKTHKDSVAVDGYSQALFIKESDEMKALLTTEKDVRKDLAALTKKMNANDKAREEAAKEAGIKFSSRKEQSDKEIDRMIKDDVRPKKNYRTLTETAVKIEDRKKVLGIEDESKKEEKKTKPKMKKASKVKKEKTEGKTKAKKAKDKEEETNGRSRKIYTSDDKA